MRYDPRNPGVLVGVSSPTKDEAVAHLEWMTFMEAARRRLVMFCRLDSRAGRVPTRVELVESIREVFYRMGWSVFRTGGETEWADYLEVVQVMLADQNMALRPALTPGSLPHKYVACCAVLGWVDAPWALAPAPWEHPQGPWPGRWPDPPPKLSEPVGWPRTADGPW